MSGHSRWSNIKRKKEKSDAQKGKIFTKIGREISVAVKQGGPDPAANSKLKEVIAKAKSFNVPNDNIEKIIKKAASGSSEANCESFTYEGYGPGNVAFIVGILTDNRNRASSNIRMYFSKNGGNLGSPGCVSFMFDEKGIILFEKDKVSEDDLLNAALDSGASDFQVEDESFVVITEKTNFDSVRSSLISKGFEPFSSELSMIPQFYQKIESEEMKNKVLNFIDLLENDEDVQSVWSNYDFEEQ